MGDFVQLVQSEGVDGPRRTKFTEKKWKAAFDSVKSPDIADRRLYDAALVIHTKLGNIRSRLKLSTTKDLTTTEKVRAFVAAANHGFLVAQEKTREALIAVGRELAQRNDDGIRPEDIFAEVKLELPGGFEWSPNEIVESLVEGIEIPIKVALQDDPDLSGNPRMAQISWKDILLELNLGITYRHTEDLWDDCLWNGYGVIEVKNRTVFVPKDIDVKRGQAVGIARRHTLWTGFSLQAKMLHREYAARGATMRIRDIKAIRKEGRKQVISVSRLGESSEAQEDQVLLRMLANEPYYQELLGKDLPSLEGVTLTEILDAWVVISRAAQMLLATISDHERAANDQEAPTHTWLPAFVPVLQTEALVQAISSAAAIAPAKGRKIVDFFTFYGKAGQEIWDSPLVPVGSKVVAPIFAAIVNPNLRRLVDIWMRRGGIDLEVRGDPFEAHVRSKMVAAINASPVLAGKAVCIADNYVFSPSAGRSEQIDLIIVIGSTVLVGESKCILEPTEAKALAMHQRTVLGAADQALRKSKALTDNRGDFVTDVARLGIKLHEDFKVVPLAVVSTSTHVGIPAKGVSVVDEYILGKYLEGELEDAGLDMSNLAVVKRIKRVFYSDLAEAEARVADYLASPPQVQRLRDGVKVRLVPLHAISETDWEGLVLTLECVPRSNAITADANL
ncbi:hypothetical protein GD416_00715 [Burkholderia sp. BE24]|uniref:hypothetical protein n=1 Tax=Burkholderia TaxID=32008 RepID=UPI000409B242|nr:MULTISPECIES: hypothetical protein [Burkholderia]MPV55012.1 hypothetical protein [Burkholderia sp. BE24]